MEKKTRKAGSSSRTSAGKTASRSAASVSRANGTAYRTDSGSAKSAKSSSKAASKGSMEDSYFGEFFLMELKDIYWAEKHLIKALTKMAKEATSEELTQAFLDHKVQTETQAARLEEVFSLLGEKPQGKKCEAIVGITSEAEEVIKETKDDTYTRDVALIIAAQKVEHYEIATYGGLVQLAKTIGNTEVAELLQETLDEEKEADQLLTGIAEGFVNEQATQE
jgi:ferritin-like metal-binding protein YciE